MSKSRDNKLLADLQKYINQLKLNKIEDENLYNTYNAERQRLGERVMSISKFITALNKTSLPETIATVGGGFLGFGITTMIFSAVSIPIAISLIIAGGLLVTSVSIIDEIPAWAKNQFNNFAKQKVPEVAWDNNIDKNKLNSLLNGLDSSQLVSTVGLSVLIEKLEARSKTLSLSSNAQVRKKIKRDNQPQSITPVGEENSRTTKLFQSTKTAEDLQNASTPASPIKKPSNGM